MRKRHSVVLLFGVAASLLSTAAFAQNERGAPEVKKEVVSGTIVSNTGKPIPGAKVFITSYNSPGRRSVVTVYANKHGNYKGEVTSVNWTVAAVADHYNCSNANPNIARSYEKITLWPEYKISGKVVDENGRPLQGVTIDPVRCQGVNYSGGYVSTGYNEGLDVAKYTTGKDGSFVIRHLPRPDDFEMYTVNVYATKSGRARVLKYCTKQDLNALSVITLPKACTLECTVKLPDGVSLQPQEGSLMLRVGGKWGGDVRDAEIGPDMRFRLGELPPGNHTFFLYDRGTQWNGGRPQPTTPTSYVMPIQQVELAPGQTEHVELVAVSGALIKGKLINKSTGKPFSTAMLQVDHAGGMTSVVPDADGNFAVRVVPGAVKISTESLENQYIDPAARQELVVSVAEGEEKTGVEIKAEISTEQVAYETQAKSMPDDFELTPGAYDLTWDPEVKCDSIARSSCVKWDHLASFDFKKKPQLVSSNPHYWIFRIDTLDDGRIGFILDESQGTGTGYDTVYVDVNRDWDLTNDPPVKLGKMAQYEYGYTDWIKVQSSKPGGYTTLRLGATWPTTNHTEILGYVWQLGAWKGNIQTNKGAAQCALIDYNSNGAYGDCVQWELNTQMKDKGDCIVADTNGAGSLGYELYGPQYIRLDPICLIGKKYYVIKSTAAGDKLTIEPYNGPMGKLALSVKDICGLNGDVRICQFIGKQGYYVVRKSGDGSIEVPAGEYKLYWISVDLKSDGKVLPVFCAIDSPVQIRPGEEARVEIGGKIAGAISPSVAQLAWKPGRTETIEWQLKIGEGIDVTAIGDRSVAFIPKVKFFDKAGKLVDTTTAGYT